MHIFDAFQFSCFALSSFTWVFYVLITGIFCVLDRSLLCIAFHRSNAHECFLFCGNLYWCFALSLNCIPILGFNLVYVVTFSHGLEFILMHAEFMYANIPLHSNPREKVWILMYAELHVLFWIQYQDMCFFLLWKVSDLFDVVDLKVTNLDQWVLFEEAKIHSSLADTTEIVEEEETRTMWLVVEVELMDWKSFWDGYH
jgi:hypothetical protein